MDNGISTIMEGVSLSAIVTGPNVVLSMNVVNRSWLSIYYTLCDSLLSSRFYVAHTVICARKQLIPFRLFMARQQHITIYKYYFTQGSWIEVPPMPSDLRLKSLP